MSNKSGKRIEQIADGKKDTRGNSLRARLAEDKSDNRRRQIQDSLNQLGDEQKQRKRKATLRTLIQQAGLDTPVRMFWVMSALAGVGFAVAPFMFGLPWFVSAGLGFVGFLGLPRWVLGYLRKRRQNVFLNDFADAIDVMVRALKAGLPVSEAMKIISTELGAPVGPEFLEVVEGQRARWQHGWILCR